MEAEFWLRKWEENDIFFHGHAANPLLVEYFKRLALPKGSRVFLPLCGKTLDIHWLLANGYRVAGAELSTIAIEQLFTELGVEPAIAEIGDLDRYSAEGIDIFVGDIFDLSRDVLGPVDAIYDRAALVALPDTMRGRYAAHVTDITGNAPQLLICFDYDQTAQPGPPFSIDAAEVEGHYGAAYGLTQLARVEVAGGLKGKSPADEIVWLLK